MVGRRRDVALDGTEMLGVGREARREVAWSGVGGHSQPTFANFGVLEALVELDLLWDLIFGEWLHHLGRRHGVRIRIQASRLHTPSQVLTNGRWVATGQ
jgi:hypothetical protein